MLAAMLRSANEHLDQVVVQAIEDLALKGPLELRIVEVARMQFKVIDMDWRIGKSGTDDDFDRFAFGAGVELYEGMLVEAKLVLNARKAVGGHPAIVAEAGYPPP